MATDTAMGKATEVKLTEDEAEKRYMMVVAFVDSLMGRRIAEAGNFDKDNINAKKLAGFLSKDSAPAKVNAAIERWDARWMKVYGTKVKPETMERHEASLKALRAGVEAGDLTRLANVVKEIRAAGYTTLSLKRSGGNFILILDQLVQRITNREYTARQIAERLQVEESALAEADAD